MYARKKKISPFVIGAKCHGFAKTEDIFPEKPAAPQEPYRAVSGFGEGLIDAETGRSISISKASWNATEGRIDLDTSTILAMGTGRLDIKNRLQQQFATATAPGSEPSTPVNGATIAPFSKRTETIRTGLLSRTSETEMGSPLEHSGSGPPSRQLKSANTASTLSSRAGTAEPAHFLFSSAPNARQTSWNGMLVTESRAVTAESIDPKFWSAPGTPAHRVRINSLTAENVSPTRKGGPSEHKRHPLISQLLKTGPLTPVMHVNWDARSNTVINTDEHGNRIDFAEEGVDYSSDEGSDGGDSTGNDDRHSVASSAVSKDSSAYAGSTLGSLVTGLHARNWRRRRAGSVSSQHSGASGSTMTKRSTRSTASNRSKEFKKDTTIGVVGDSIIVSNTRNWQAIEERWFQELFAVAWDYEENKRLTGEPCMDGGLQAVRLHARNLARIKVKGMRELVQATADEKRREEQRMALEAENATKYSYLMELQRLHEEERKKSRRYLHALEHDNEVILIRAMTEVGWLW